MAEEIAAEIGSVHTETSVSDALNSDAQASPIPPPADPAADALFADSLGRIQKFIPLASGAIALALLWKGTRGSALGFLLAASVSWINFMWLKGTITALTNAITRSGVQASRPSVVLRFITRFVLIAVGAYVIFISYPVAFHGFLGGLFVPVLAIFMEAAYVVLAAVRPSISS